jgi:hypothetical protein
MGCINTFVSLLNLLSKYLGWKENALEVVVISCFPTVIGVGAEYLQLLGILL